MKVSIHKISMFFLIIYIILLPVDTALGNIIGSVSIINYIALFYVIFRIIEILKRRTINLRSINNNIFIIIYYFYMLLTLLYRSTEDYNSFYVLILSINFIVCILIMEEDYTKKEKNYLINCILFSMISVIIMYFTVGTFKMNGRLALNANKNTDPNFFAIGLSLITSVYTYNILFNTKRIVSIFMLGLVFVFILMTGSRGGLISNGIVIISLFAFSKITIKKKIFFILGIILLLCFFYVFSNQLISQQILNRFSLGYTRGDSGAGRFNIWNNALNYFFYNSNIFRSFFGHGIGTFNILNIYNNHASHNIFISNLLEGGFIGIILLIIVLYKSLYNSFKNYNYIFFAALLGLYFGAMRCRFIRKQSFMVLYSNSK